jgi:hypothetical protein
MQRPDTECTIDSVYLKTCLWSEINSLNLVEASPKAFITSSESLISFPSSINYWNRSSGEKYHQCRSNDLQVIESTFCVGDCFGIYRAENLLINRAHPHLRMDNLRWLFPVSRLAVRPKIGSHEVGYNRPFFSQKGEICKDMLDCIIMQILYLNLYHMRYFRWPWRIILIFYVFEIFSRNKAR